MAFEIGDRIDHEELEDTRKRYFPDSTKIIKYRRYADGEADWKLTVDQKRILGTRATNQSNDNLLRLVLLTIAARLDFRRWIVEGSQPTQDFLDGVYLKSRMAKLQADTHFAMLRDGITANSLRWKRNADGTGRVSIHREQWWNGKEGIFIAFDDFGDPIWAVRDFVEHRKGAIIERRVIYYADAIERYVKEGGAWLAYALPDDPPGSKGKIPWLKDDGTPLGLPVIPFANSTGDSGDYGISDMVGLLGMQDDMNGVQTDISAAAMFTGFKMYTATGTAETKFVVGPGRILISSNPATKFDALEAGEVQPLIEAHNHKRQTIAIDTATPMHQIGGQWPSGEALLRSEMPLVDKAIRLTRSTSPWWILEGHRATEMGNRFGTERLDEEAEISAEFAAPERLDEMTRLLVDQARVNLYSQLSMISDPELLEKTGLLTTEEIAAIIAGRAERAAAAVQTEVEF